MKKPTGKIGPNKVHVNETGRSEGLLEKPSVSISSYQIHRKMSWMILIFYGLYAIYVTGTN